MKLSGRASITIAAAMRRGEIATSRDVLDTTVDGRTIAEHLDDGAARREALTWMAVRFTVPAALKMPAAVGATIQKAMEP